MKPYRFSWTKKFSVPAPVFGQWLYDLENRSADGIIEAARNKNCVAHKLFEWDDTAAARAHRLSQARELVSSLAVEIVNSKKKTENVRAFVASADRGVYALTLEASDDELDAAEQRCLQEMSRMRARWRSIQLARSVVQAIDEVQARSNRKRKKAA